MWSCKVSFVHFVVVNREDDLEGAEGVINAREEIITKQEELFKIIRRLASDASRLHETLLLFKANCDDVSVVNLTNFNCKTDSRVLYKVV